MRGDDGEATGGVDFQWQKAQNSLKFLNQKGREGGLENLDGNDFTTTAPLLSKLGKMERVGGKLNFWLDGRDVGEGF